MTDDKTLTNESPKSRLIALLLCFFLGWAGGHRFYCNKLGTGLIMLFTMGGFGLWYFVDIVMISLGSFKDKDNLPISRW
ncbi:MAG: TM2 domain-containing protein [Nitrospirae bacterium]|nr:TM2 domain-containing protein [Nitrospirota bacterium]